MQKNLLKITAGRLLGLTLTQLCPNQLHFHFKNYFKYVRFDVFTAVTMKNVIFGI
jgi:hypothetical protein